MLPLGGAGTHANWGSQGGRSLQSQVRGCRQFPVIVGPTAGGKSALAVDAALAMDGEIVTADAFQVYRGMDIGTAKPTAADRRGVPHHLIDIVDPGERFTLADWLAAAERAVAGILARGRTPVVVGGTHLYIKAFLEGMFEGPAQDEVVREELRRLTHADLRAELERVDPGAARRLHPNDQRRSIRAIEVFRLTGKPISEHQQQWDREDHRRRDCALVGIEWPAEEINRRINARVRGMVECGFVDEARGLWQSGRLIGQAREALGYKQLAEHLEGRTTLEEALERIKIETRRFAKNQRTWMRRLRLVPGAVWIDAAASPPAQWVGLVRQACGGDSDRT